MPVLVVAVESWWARSDSMALHRKVWHSPLCTGSLVHPLKLPDVVRLVAWSSMGKPSRRIAENSNTVLNHRWLVVGC